MVEDARKDISERTDTYNKYLNKLYDQQIKNQKKHNDGLKKTQFDNTTKDKGKIAARVALGVLSGGLSEGVSFTSKQIGKKIQPSDSELILRIEELKNQNNPFMECIENADDLLLYKKPIMRDDKYLYYQIEE